MNAFISLLCVAVLFGCLFVDKGFAAEKGAEPQMFSDDVTGLTWYSTTISGNHGSSSDLIAINYYPETDQFTFFYNFPTQDVPVNEETRILIDNEISVLRPNSPLRTPLERTWLVAETDEIEISRQLVENICNGRDVSIQFLNESTRHTIGISDGWDHWKAALTDLLSLSN